MLFSVLSPSPTPPSTLLTTQLLFHLPPPRGLSFLQPLHPLRLPRRRLVRHRLPPNLKQQVVQSAEASVRVVRLFPRVVGLDYEGVRFGRVVARGEDGGAEDWWEEGEEGGGWEAEGGFGGDSGRMES